MTTWADIKHFKPDEFVCRCRQCGSDGTEMDIDFISKLDALRERLGFALFITSGYRCPTHNQAVSTTGEDGPHTTGRAADVAVHGEQVYSVVQQATLRGFNRFTGIGVNQRGDYAKRFVHLDDLTPPDHPRPRIWTY